MPPQIPLIKALSWKYPNTTIVVTDGEIKEFGGGPLPERKTIESILSEYKGFLDSNAYKEDRKKEYPLIEDQLDALWKAVKALQVLAKVTIVDPEVMAVADSIQAVKDKYPKPIDKPGKIK